MTESFGLQLQARRTAMGISVQQLADRSGVGAPLLLRYEAGADPIPDLSHVRALAKVLGCSMSSLLQGDEQAAAGEP